MNMDIRNPTNITHITLICKRFLSERFKVDLEGDALDNLITSAISDLEGSREQYDTIEEANKAIIVKVRDQVIQQPAPPPHAIRQPIEDVDEDDFFQKLQQLETQRTLPPPANAHPPPPTHTALSMPSMPAMPSSSVVYLPSGTQPKISKSVIVQGTDRMWEYFTKRSTLVWSGPVPSNSSHFDISRVMLPKCVAMQTPVVNIEITGAAGNTVHAVCTLISTGPVWDTWISSCTQLKALACPWTIKLTDAMGQCLQMGDDGYSVVSCGRLYNGHTKITFDSMQSDAIAKHTQLLLRMSDGKDTVIKVLNYDLDSEAIEIAADARNFTKSRVCNLHQQACIILTFTVATAVAVTQSQ